MTDIMQEVTLKDLLEQRLDLTSTASDPAIMTDVEAEALLATATPGARNSFNLIATSDAFAPSGRRFIAPIIKRNGDPSTAHQIQKLSNRHLAIMDFMLENPRASMLTVAQEFGVTQSWLSTVKNSDLWSVTYNERRKLLEHHQKVIIADQLTSIVAKGLGCLEDAIDDPDTTLASKMAITKMALEHAGIGKEPAVAVTIDNSVTTNNVIQMDESKQKAIAEARARVLAKASQQHNLRSGITLDAQP